MISTHPTIIFLGASALSAQVLAELIHSQQVKLTAIITHPDKPIGRHQTLTPSPIASLASQHQLPLYKLSSLDKIPPQIILSDYLITAAYGKLIPPIWLNIPKKSALNLHPSLLPAYRGSSPIPWAILDGAAETGITLMQLNTQFDTGHLLAQQKIPLQSTATTTTLLPKLFHLGSILLLNYLTHTSDPHIFSHPQPQSAKSPTRYARKLTKQDGCISLKQINQALSGHLAATTRLDQMMRALWPWPGIWTTNSDNTRLLLLKGHPHQHTYYIESLKPAGKNIITQPKIIQKLLT